MSTAAPAGAAASLLAPVVRDLRTDSASDANGDVFRVYEWRAPVPAPVSGDSDVDTPPAPAQVPKAPLICASPSFLRPTVHLWSHTMRAAMVESTPLVPLFAGIQ
ncbi:hypothetical protein HDU84_009430 [Entophlyctis sp. JEL0112]|nr:hypothetical protein HDU84_009430 [Entophlyctis sp. JEL0112]